MQREVAERVEHVVAGEVRHRQHVDAIDIALHAHEAGLAATVRHVDPVRRARFDLRRRHRAGDEERVGTAHQRRRGEIELRHAPHDDRRRLGIDTARVAGLDVLGAVAEALPHLQLEAACACSVRTTPFMRLRRRVCGSMPSTPIDAPTRSAACSGSATSGRASIASVCAAGVRMKARRAHQHRCVRLACAVDAAQEHERELAEQLAMRIGHVVAHRARAHLGQALAQTHAALQRLFPFVIRVAQRNGRVGGVHDAMVALPRQRANAAACS